MQQDLPGEPGSASVIGQQIRKRRDSLGLKQTELGELAGGVTASQVAQYEGGNTVMSATRLADFARALKCSADFLLGLTEDADAVFPTGWVMVNEDLEEELLEEQNPRRMERKLIHPKGPVVDFAMEVPKTYSLVPRKTFEKRKKRLHKHIEKVRGLGGQKEGSAD